MSKVDRYNEVASSEAEKLNTRDESESPQLKVEGVGYVYPTIKRKCLHTMMNDTDQVEICVISLECLCVSLLPSVIDGIIFSTMCCFGCQDELLCTLSIWLCIDVPHISLYSSWRFTILFS